MITKNIFKILSIVLGLAYFDTCMAADGSGVVQATQSVSSVTNQPAQTSGFLGKLITFCKSKWVTIPATALIALPLSVALAIAIITAAIVMMVVAVFAAVGLKFCVWAPIELLSFLYKKIRSGRQNDNSNLNNGYNPIKDPIRNTSNASKISDVIAGGFAILASIAIWGVAALALLAAYPVTCFYVHKWLVKLIDICQARLAASKKVSA